MGLTDIQNIHQLLLVHLGHLRKLKLNKFIEVHTHSNTQIKKLPSNVLEKLIYKEVFRYLQEHLIKIEYQSIFFFVHKVTAYRRIYFFCFFLLFFDDYSLQQKSQTYKKIKMLYKSKSRSNILVYSTIRKLQE